MAVCMVTIAQEVTTQTKYRMNRSVCIHDHMHYVLDVEC